MKSFDLYRGDIKSTSVPKTQSLILKLVPRQVLNGAYDIILSAIMAKKENQLHCMMT